MKPLIGTDTNTPYHPNKIIRWTIYSGYGAAPVQGSEMPTGPALAYVTLRRSLEKPQGGLPQDDEPRQTSDKLVRLISGESDGSLRLVRF